MELKKAMVAMSGGVDSSVAALLMKEQGYQTMGITLKLYGNDDVGLSRGHTCCSLDDVEDARAVAYRLGIPFYVFNFTERFQSEVICRFIRCYSEGGTPNPCIDCNRYIKFDALGQRMQELGFDYVVTGHYANVELDPVSGRYLLKKGLDTSKDQSYVLYHLTQEQLAHTLFPLGHLPKTQVRALAEQYGFVNAHKHDSQDICFVPDGDYSIFIERYSGRRFPEGNFVDGSGNILGRHQGIIRYTIGQRKGLGMASSEPLYVCGKQPEQNTVTVGPGSQLYSNSLIARDINLISVASIERPLRVKAKIRYRQQEQWATVTQTAEDELKVVFDEPQRAIAPGQAVVCYDGNVVVGGGTILIPETDLFN